MKRNSMSKADQQLVTAEHHHRQIKEVSLEDMQIMAKAIAEGGMFGVKTEAAALSVMLLCQAEGLHPALAVRRYHIIDNKPAFRADALQGEFELRGAILWHQRTDIECAATFFADKKKVDAAAIKRAKDRYTALNEAKDVSGMAEMGELTIIRTIQDAIDKQVALTWKDGKQIKKKNWEQSPRQMLHARCLTEGVRAIAPGLIAGIYTEDEIMDFLPDPEGSPGQGNGGAEARVGTAITNREPISEGPVAEAEIIEEAPAQTSEVTEENYKDVECHIGKAGGRLLGKKVGEFNEHIIGWFKKNPHQIPAGNDPKDARLRKALEIAISKLPADTSTAAAEEKQPESAAPGVTNWRAVAVPFTCKIKGQLLGSLPEGVFRAIKDQLLDPMDWKAKDIAPELIAFKAAYELGGKETGWTMDKEQLIAGLLARADELIITEEQLCKYLREQGMLENGQAALTDATEAILRYAWYNWAQMEELIKDDLAPKVDHTKGKKTAKKKDK